MERRYEPGVTVWRVTMSVQRDGQSDVTELTIHVVADMPEVDVRNACEQWAEDAKHGHYRKAIVKHCEKWAKTDFCLLDGREKAALRTLDKLGYTWQGGELWKPPLGKQQ